MQDDFWKDRFHFCAIASGFIAHGQGRLHDAEYVKSVAYFLYEEWINQQDNLSFSSQEHRQEGQ